MEAKGIKDVLWGFARESRGEISPEDVTSIVWSDDGATITAHGKTVEITLLEAAQLGFTKPEVHDSKYIERPHEEGYGCWCKPHQIFKGKMLGEMGTVYLHSYAKPSRKDVLEAVIKAVYMGEDGHLI